MNQNCKACVCLGARGEDGTCRTRKVLAAERGTALMQIAEAAEAPARALHASSPSP